MHICQQWRNLLATTWLAAFMLLPGHAMAQSAQLPPATVLTVAAREPELSTFYKLIQQAGLTASLEATGPMTVFAPTNDAFKALPAATLDRLSRDPDWLKSVLTFHLVPRTLKAADTGAPTPLITLNGATVTAAKAGDFVTVDEGLVTTADLTADNGILHILDRVLVPAVKK